MITQEVARNLEPRTSVKCSSCLKEFSFSAETIVEEPLPYPYNTVVEGFIVCPYCGLKRHSYYMPERLRFDMHKLKQTLLQYHTTKSTKDFNRYRILHESYKHNFDAAQKKFKEIFAVEETDGESTA